ncbi:MAG: hypothetical protein ACMUIE_10920 [Thermoplasmatota archaeon]
MPAFKLGEREVRLIVVVFSILGLILLAVIGSLAEVPEVELSKVKDHHGDRIWTRGIVVGTEGANDGGERLLLYDEGGTLEVFAERGAGGLRSGTEIRVKGEVFLSHGEPTLTVQSEGSIEKVSGGQISPFDGLWVVGEAYWFKGSVASVQWNSYGDGSVLVRTSGSTGGNGSQFQLRVYSFDEDIRAGDQVNITGLVTGEREVLSFGSRSIQITGRSSSVSASIERLIEEMRFSPEDGPSTPVTLQGYLKYEPAGRSFYLSDVPEGSTISIKVVHNGDAPGLHKGDLVEITNCSMIWDPSGMRYHLEPGSVSLVEQYGPWSLSIGSLEGGVEMFNLCSVSIEGYIHEEGGRTYLLDQGSRLEIRNITAGPGQDLLTLVGTVMLDPELNSYYLDVEGASP